MSYIYSTVPGNTGSRTGIAHFLDNSFCSLPMEVPNLVTRCVATSYCFAWDIAHPAIQIAFAALSMFTPH